MNDALLTKFSLFTNQKEITKAIKAAEDSHERWKRKIKRTL